MEREKLLALNNLTSIRIINLNPLISGDTARNFKGLLASCSAPPPHTEPSTCPCIKWNFYGPWEQFRPNAVPDATNNSRMPEKVELRFSG